jgi:acetyltransferase-like isoleucine patch superfamily enzyme
MLIFILQKIYNYIVFSTGRWRARLLGLFFSHCGDGVVIMKGFTFRSPKGISIASGTTIGYNCFFDGGGKVTVGSDCLIAQHVSIFTTNHRFDEVNVLIKDQGYVKKAVHIGDNVWLGANIIILPGVHIGKGSVIGAGSVITKDIPDWSIAVGVPAKIIKKRK